MIRGHIFDPAGGVACEAPIEKILAAAERTSVWLDIEAPTPEEVALLANHYQFHPLAIEDSTHLQKRAKFERYANHAFVVLCALDRTTREDVLDTVPVCLFVRPRLVVSVHPKRVTAVERVTNLLAREPERVGRQTERVLHSIVDAVIDEFLPVVEDQEDLVDSLERRVSADHDHRLLEALIRARRDLLQVRRIILPHVEVLRRLVDPESPEIGPEYRVYFRDVLDHAMVVSENVTLHLDVANGAIAVHANAVNERTNEVMKYLAVVSTMLLPWTIISGIFGMNFDVIPTAHDPFGFVGAIGLMVVAAASLLGWFWHKRWIGSRR